MLASIASAVVRGADGHPVTVEVHIAPGLPGLTIVGLPDASCREARDRVRAAVTAAGVPWPAKRITVNLAPSADKTVGSGLDLAIAVAVLVAETDAPAVYTPEDEALLTAVASVVANAVEASRAQGGDPVDAVPLGRGTPPAHRPEGTRVRFFAVDGSTFLDDEYLIKGLAGLVLWALLGHYEREGRTEFTNKEVRLDPSLELPDFRDNLESRLILLKRRLIERDAPIRIEKTGRGRFRLLVDGPLVLEER